MSVNRMSIVRPLASRRSASNAFATPSTTTPCSSNASTASSLINGSSSTSSPLVRLRISTTLPMTPLAALAVEALEEQGFVVEVVSNAFDALRRLASGRTIDILFTDINLAGGVDGATLARRARQLLPDLPVIYTSGRCAMDRQDRVEGAMFRPK